MAIHQFLIVSILLFGLIHFGQGEDENCMTSVGGLINLKNKLLVETDQSEPLDAQTQFSIKNLPKNYRINRPGVPLTDDIDLTRLTVSVDVNDIITDAECI